MEAWPEERQGPWDKGWGAIPGPHLLVREDTNQEMLENFLGPQPPSNSSFLSPCLMRVQTGFLLG